MPRPAPRFCLVTAAAALLACQRPSGPGESTVAVSADSAVAPAAAAGDRPDTSAPGPGALARALPPAPGSALAVPPSSVTPLVASLIGRACQPLPAVRPSDWSLTFVRTTLPIHGPHKREALTLATSCAPHGKLCQPVAPAELDALYATSRRLGFSGDWEVNARDVRSPHHGSRELSARWGQVECRVHDGRGTWVDPAHDGDFKALIDALFATSERAKAGRPTPAP